MRTALKVVAVAAATALILFVPIPARAAVTNDERAGWAAGYISSFQRTNGSIPAFSTIGSTADAVVALVVAHRGPTNIKKALNYLARRVHDGSVDAAPAYDKVGLQAKIVLAVAAAGQNPRAFGGVDLVQAILDAEQPDGRYGSATGVFNHAYAMLALEAAGVPPSANARGWLLDAQCGDGGWQYSGPPGPADDSHCVDTGAPLSDWFASDTNTTSLAVQALEAGSGAQSKVDPFTFFDALRDDGFGGWGYTWAYSSTDANSTGLVVQAYAAAGHTLPVGALAALKRLQYKYCGAFAYNWGTSGASPVLGPPNIGATLAGLLGILKQPLPVAATAVTKPAPAPMGCPS